MLGLLWRHSLPPPDAILPQLLTEPVQEPLSPARAKSFVVERQGVEYTIIPRYEYAMYGLVVEEHDAEGWLAYTHKVFGDYINTRDLCVLWGPNVSGDHYLQMDYSHGEWTCYVRTDDRLAWNKFQLDALANNHVLPANAAVAEAVRAARIGDQVLLRGRLVDYAMLDGFTRATSTTRKDTGDGACEVVYVEEFQVLQTANSFWRFSFAMGGPMLLAGVVLAAVSFFSSGNDSSNPWFYVDRAEKAAMQGDFDAALADFNAALSRSPGLAEALEGKAVILETMGRYEEAKRCREAAGTSTSGPQLPADMD